MTSKQRAYLMSQASTMDPIFQIGKASLTPEIITALDEALEKRELIKKYLFEKIRQRDVDFVQKTMENFDISVTTVKRYIKENHHM